ncbi:MAG: hypothetical protein GY809_02765 [Planctomycetes bacterium]|nr:hypothetical protein [Planctomycetota bacterium]
MLIKQRAFCLLTVAAMCLGHNIALSDPLYFQPPTPVKITYEYQSVATIGVCIDLGDYINIQDANAIKVYQAAFNGSDPFTTYYGCGQINVYVTFPAVLRAKAESTSPAGGTWSATLNHQTHLPIPTGTSDVTVCVLGTEVHAYMLVASEAQANVPVAQIIIQVIPQ